MPAKGFTLIELLIVLAIGGMMVAVAGPLVGQLPSGSQLDDVVGDIKQVIELARARSVAGVASSTNGVLLEVNSGIPDRYIIFRGATYTSRDSAYDEATEIREAIDLQTSLTGGATEITFSPLNGIPSATGTIMFDHSTGDSRTLLINDLGFISTQ